MVRAIEMNLARLSLLSTSLAALAIAQPAAAQATVREFNIPAQPLSSALLEFSRQSDVLVVVSPEVVNGKRAPALRGSLPVNEAIGRLLRGSGLRAVPNPRGGYRIERAAPPAVADASSAAAPDAAVEAEAIIVTGSRIARSSKSVPGSVTVFDRERIDRSGEGTIRGVLELSSQAGMTPTQASSFLGAAPVQLRGLSAGTTLVLVNGRRVTPSGATGVSFDVGSIPLAAVERIEVLADGASAIYGADAVGGIVNVVLKSSGTGLTVDGRLGVADGGVGEERRLSATYGFSTGRLRGSISADYFDTGGILFSDRARTRDLDYRRFGSLDRRLPYTDQGTVHSLSGGNLPGLTATRAIIPVTSNDRPTIPDFAATAGQVSVGGDYYQLSSIQSPIERYGAVADLSYDVSDDVTLFANALASRQNGKYVVVRPYIDTTTIVPASNPYNPFGVNVGVNRLLTGVDPDVNHTRDTFLRFLAGVRGKAGADLRWEVAVNYSRDNNRVHEENYFDTARLAAVLNNPDPNATLNLFATGPVASEAVLDSLFQEVDKRYLASALSADAQLTGSLFPLPGGNLSFALGAEVRREKIDITSPFDNTKGRRDVASGYFELRAPVLDTLTLSGAGRFDHYSDFGSSFNPKLGFEWTPTKAVMLSGTWGTSFRAPPLAFINSVAFVVPLVVTDPLRGNESVTVPTTRGANPNLQAETADSYTVSLRVTPLDTASHHLDANISAWWVSQADRVVTPNGQTLVDNASRFSDRVIRSAPTPADIAAGRPGALQSIDASYINFGTAKTNGIDAQVNYRGEGGATRWSVNGSVTRVLNYKAELVPGLVENRLGSFSFDGYAPKWRGSITGSIGQGPVDLTGTLRYIGSYQDRRGTPYILGDRAFVDLQLSMQSPATAGPLQNVRVTVGASNLLNTQPPFFNLSLGYDPFNYNNRGRFIYTSVRKAF
ncbi:TonB-dependent receptor [Sphingopyxis sp. CCNWLW253]|uniref:TonB-dependent receptor n=1 Tax=unclassified Sphingopyxis TaxID=2614943 RepID=UPI003012E931